MKLRDIGEAGLIKWIEEELSSLKERAVIGIGDDAAAVEVSPEKLLLFTTDSLVEGVHFRWDYTSPYHVGWKGLAVNISDIAAMGGNPTCGVVSLCLSKDTEVSLIKEVYRGLKDIASLYRIDIAGGNIARSSVFVLTIMLLGEVRRGELLLRSGAKLGDLIYVTGELGSSAAGLTCLREANLKVPEEARRLLVRRHLMPSVRLKEGRKIAKGRFATAMIDLSDGLASDLLHLAEKSRVGALIYEDKIPISPFMEKLAEELGKSPLEWALYGGEDYELLFTVSPEKKEELEKLDISLSLIGRIVERQEGVSLVKACGKRVRLRDKGYDHFRL